MTMDKIRYKEYLKNPLWQRKRLEIMQRDDFTCQICGHKDKTLNVHHIWYEPNKKPWDYPNNALITLCEECHEAEYDSYKHIIEWIDALKKDGVLMIEIESLFNHVDLSLSAFRYNDVITAMLGYDEVKDDDEPKQDYWGLDSSGDCCERIALWRNRLIKNVRLDKNTQEDKR